MVLRAQGNEEDCAAIDRCCVVDFGQDNTGTKTISWECCKPISDYAPCNPKQRLVSAKFRRLEDATVRPHSKTNQG